MVFIIYFTIFVTISTFVRQIEQKDNKNDIERNGKRIYQSDRAAQSIDLQKESK